MTIWSCWGGASSMRLTRGERKVIKREGCGKDAPLVKAALHRDIPAVGAGDGPGQAEPQAGSGLGAAPVSSVETFENEGQILSGYTNPRVFDREGYTLSFAWRK